MKLLLFTAMIATGCFALEDTTELREGKVQEDLLPTPHARSNSDYMFKVREKCAHTLKFPSYKFKPIYDGSSKNKWILNWLKSKKGSQYNQKLYDAIKGDKIEELIEGEVTSGEEIIHGVLIICILLSILLFVLGCKMYFSYRRRNYELRSLGLKELRKKFFPYLILNIVTVITVLYLLHSFCDAWELTKDKKGLAKGALIGGTDDLHNTLGEGSCYLMESIEEIKNVEKLIDKAILSKENGKIRSLLTLLDHNLSSATTYVQEALMEDIAWIKQVGKEMLKVQETAEDHHASDKANRFRMFVGIAFGLHIIMCIQMILFCVKPEILSKYPGYEHPFKALVFLALGIQCLFVVPITFAAWYSPRNSTVLTDICDPLFGDEMGAFYTEIGENARYKYKSNIFNETFGETLFRVKQNKPIVYIPQMINMNSWQWSFETALANLLKENIGEHGNKTVDKLLTQTHSAVFNQTNSTMSNSTLSQLKGEAKPVHAGALDRNMVNKAKLNPKEIDELKNKLWICIHGLSFKSGFLYNSYMGLGHSICNNRYHHADLAVNGTLLCFYLLISAVILLKFGKLLVSITLLQSEERATPVTVRFSELRRQEQSDNRPLGGRTEEEFLIS